MSTRTVAQATCNCHVQRPTEGDRARFRFAVASLPHGDLRAVCTAIAYALDDQSERGKYDDGPREGKARLDTIVTAAANVLGVSW